MDDASHRVIHEFMDVIWAAIDKHGEHALRRNGVKVNIEDVIGACLSVTANLVDKHSQGDQRGTRLRLCEEFFQQQYLS